MSLTLAFELLSCWRSSCYSCYRCVACRREVVSAFVGLAIGPVTARAIELLTQLIGNGMLPLDLLVVSWLA